MLRLCVYIRETGAERKKNRPGGSIKMVGHKRKAGGCKTNCKSRMKQTKTSKDKDRAGPQDDQKEGKHGGENEGQL